MIAIAMCVECSVYMQSEQNSTSSIFRTGTYFSHDVTSLSGKFVTTSYTLALCSPGRLNLRTAELRLWSAGGFYTKDSSVLQD